MPKALIDRPDQIDQLNGKEEQAEGNSRGGPLESESNRKVAEEQNAFFIKSGMTVNLLEPAEY